MRTKHVDTSTAKNPKGLILGHASHAAAAMWPMLDHEQLEMLAGDIRENGLVDPIVLLKQGSKELILDGRNRGRACEIAGIRPRFEYYKGKGDDASLVAFVVSKNEHRRHLSTGARALIAADLATMTQGRPSQSGKFAGLTQAEAAKQLRVSERVVRHAAVVRDEATPKVREAVMAGKLAIDAGAALALRPKAEQNAQAEKALAKNGETKSGHIRALVRQAAKRDVVRKINTDQVRPMPLGPFGLIVTDYPWKFENSDQHEGSRGHLPYPPMTMPQIYAHAGEATKRAADHCVLGLWITNAHLLEAKGVLEAWGFAYQSTITWDKVHVGMGISGPRGQTEHLIIAYRGSPTHTLNDITTLIRTPREPGHSKKPDLFYDVLAKHCTGPRLELFAIGQREGWECWGADADKPARKSKILTATDERASEAAA